ncbi:aminopeptidase P family protein [Pseudomonas sp. BN415]|uniref:M24 family metallopeptidase n=1 Tax=Pseudomonas sp. BN415 TaxID=2567889 RepID=UPI00245578DA|nr:Xaa-Pro peptidase family protein [Pseudomonas sp. BN415]MDH4582625.1 aminopeptidase P family protein [Pseudomonas sp. BN415]
MGLAFSPAEFESRVSRVQAEMKNHNLDALLITSPANFRYFTGLDSQFWESPTRPWFFIIPADGMCVAVVPEIGAPLLKGSWIGQTLSWPAPRPADEGVSLLSQALLALPRRYGRIGMEMGRESVVRMPLNDLFALKDSLKSTTLVDGSPCIWRVRAIKSCAEVDYIRQSCSIVSDAFDKLPSHARCGQTEREISQALAIDILAGGAHALPFVASASGAGGYEQFISRPSDRQIVDGDVLIIDVGATVNGYFCDFDRNFGFGNVADAALRANEAVWDATEAALAVAHPGTKVAELWRTMMDVLEPAGMLGSNVGRLGHGLGLQLTEPPSHMPGDDTTLEEGMVITIEPGMEYAPGKMIAHEENVHITRSGPVLLTRRAPREMAIITL